MRIPGVETPGYFQMSLRDMDLMARTYRPASAASLSLERKSSATEPMVSKFSFTSSDSETSQANSFSRARENSSMATESRARPDLMRRVSVSSSVSAGSLADSM